jgi:hypothetical protein
VHGASVEALVRELGEAGGRSVCCVRDVAVEATDATVVVSGFLKSLYPAASWRICSGCQHPQ